MEAWNLWHANYWLAGILKAITAAVSIPTAILLVRLVPQALDLPNASQWIHARASLEKEVREKKILYWNRGAERLYGYGWQKEEAWGKITHELLRTRFLFVSRCCAWPARKLRARPWRHGNRTHG
jgi:hypothetical protein